MKDMKAKLEIDDAFIPKRIKFTECGRTLDVFIDDESIQVQVWDADKPVSCFRLPLYARIALAQLLTPGSLNGQRLLK